MDQGGRVVWYFDADLGNFVQATGTAAKAAASVGTAITSVEKSGKASLDNLGGVAQDLAHDFSDLGAGLSLIGSSFSDAGKAIGDIAAQIGGDIGDLATFFGNVLTDAVSTASERIGDFVSGLVETISQTQVVQQALSVISDAYDSLSNVVSTAIGNIRDTFNAISNIAEGVARQVEGFFSATAQKIGNAFSAVGTAISSGANAISRSISSAASAVGDFAVKLAQPVVQSKAFQTAMTVAAAAGNAFQRSVAAVGDAAQVVAARVSALGAPFQRLVSALGPIPGLVGNVVTSLAKIGWSAAQAGAAGLGKALDALGGFAVDASKKIGELAVATTKIAFKTIEKSAVAAGAALIGLGAKGLSSANQLQSLQISMNGLTHSMTLGAEAMAGAFEFAQRSPFQLPDVAATTKTLIAFGETVGDAVGNLELLGNVSITSGIPLQSIASIFGEVSAQGRLTNGVITQLTQDGVAILPQLQKQFGKTADEVRNMAERGQISFADFRTAMGNMVDPTILDQLTNTMPRQLDRLKGSIRQLSNSFVGVGVDATNGFTQASNGIAAASTSLIKVLADTLRSPEIKAAAQKVGDALVPIINGLAKIIPPVAEFISNLATKFSELGKFALPILGLMAGAFSGLAAGIPVIGNLLGGLSGPIGIIIGLLGTLFAESPELRKSFGDAFKVIGDTLKGLAPVFAQVFGTFGEIFKTVGAALAPVVVALAGAFSEILKAVLPLLPVLAELFLDIIKKVVVPLIPFVIQIIGILATTFTAVLKAITPLLPVIASLVITIFQQILLPLLPLLVQLIQLLADVFIMVLNAVLPLLPPLLGLVQVLVTALAPILPQLVDLFIQLVVALIPLIPPLLQLVLLVLPPLISLLTIIINVLSNFAVIIITVVIGAVKLLVDVLALIVDAIVHVIDFFNRLVNIGVTQFNNLKDAISGTVGNILGVIASIPQKIREAFGDAGKILQDSGRKVIDGLVNGIKDKFSAVKDTLTGLTNKLKDWKGPADLDARLLTPSGNLIMEGFQKGLEASYGNIKNSLGDFTKSLGANISLGVDPNALRTVSSSAAAPIVGSIGGATAISGNTTNVENHIGTIQLSNDVDADNFLKKLTRQDEVTSTGLTSDV